MALVLSAPGVVRPLSLRLPVHRADPPQHLAVVAAQLLPGDAGSDLKGRYLTKELSRARRRQ